jgi:hypothetical protein
MYLRSVRVPKNNLFTKYVEVSDCGQLKQVGDSRVGYGTMMFIRELISCAIPKVYGQASSSGPGIPSSASKGVNAANNK